MGDHIASVPIIWKSTDPEYERARVGRVFNHRRPSRFPIAVVEVTEEDHVVEAVKLARDNQARVSIRSGGHSWAAWSVRDNAVLIDFGKYKFIDWNEDTKIVSVSPSTTGRELNGFLRQKGMLFPGGHCPDVGLGGFLLQGGMGWVCRSWGWACGNIEAIDVVTADGSKLRCSEKEHADLFWAARGAGPGFPAVVTRYHLRPRPLPTHLRSSGFIYPKEKFKTVLNWVKSAAETFDEDTEIVCVGLYHPDYSESVVLVSFTSFKWSDAAAIEASRPAEASAPDGYLQKWFNRPTSLEQEYCAQAMANPAGHRWCCDNAYIDNEADTAEVLEDAFTTLPNRKTFALWFSMAPVSRRPLPDMAVSMQSDHYFALYTLWEDERDDDLYQSWVKSIMANVGQSSVGQYLGDSDFQVRNTKYWADNQGAKLMNIRRKWDSEGRICGYLDKEDQSGVNGLKNQL